MRVLSKLKEKILSYFSPQKTHERRSKPFKAPSRPFPCTPANKSSRRIANETPLTGTTLVATTPLSTSKHSRACAKLPLTPSPTPQNSGKRNGRNGRGADTKRAGVSFNPSRETIAVPQEEHDGLARLVWDPASARRKRKVEIDQQRANGWTKDEIAVYHKLSMRGREPLFPDTWKMDFGILPEQLFSSNPEEAFIKPALGSDFRAIKAFWNLCDTGMNIRDSLFPTSHRRPETVLHREIARYNKWAHQDGKLYANRAILPILVVGEYSAEAPTSDIEADMLEKLGNLGLQWLYALRLCASVEVKTGQFAPSPTNAVSDVARNAFRTMPEDDAKELPTLYGIVCSSTIMAFISYDIVDPGKNLRRPFAILDFSDKDYDFWNSVALAILLIHCRNRESEFTDWFHGSTHDDDDRNIPEDPDA